MSEAEVTECKDANVSKDPDYEFNAPQYLDFMELKRQSEAHKHEDNGIFRF